jgi:membrane protein YqaA with SNARE-associated domain
MSSHSSVPVRPRESPWFRGFRTALAVTVAIAVARATASAEPAGPAGTRETGDAQAQRGLRDRAELEAPATTFAIALALPVLGAVLTIAAALASVRQWRARVGTLAGRVRYSAVVIVALLFQWSLDQWNLFGWRF